MAVAGGIAIAFFGVLIVAQVLKGDALGRLGIA